MNKRGLTAWEAIRLLLLEAETEIKPDLELRSGGTIWVDTEYYKQYGLLQLLDWLAVGTWYAEGHRTPLDPNKQAERIPAHLWAVGLLKIYPDDNTVSGSGLEYIRVLYYEGGCKPSVSIAAAEDRCREWLVEELKAPRTKRKVDYQAEVEAEKEKGGRFHGLTDNAFRRAWKDAKKEQTTHPSWDKHGPVRSS